MNKTGNDAKIIQTFDFGVAGSRTHELSQNVYCFMDVTKHGDYIHLNDNTHSCFSARQIP